MKSLCRNQAGFTVPELIVVMVLTLLFSSMVISFALDFWGSTTRLQNSSENLVTRQNLGDTLRDQLNPVTSLLNQNSIPDSHASVSDPTDITGSHWLVLHVIPDTTSMPSSGITPLLYYAAPSLDMSKNIIMNGTAPLTDDFVLYLNASDKSLRLRTLANPNASGNRLKTSCPIPNASPSCPPDRILAQDVTKVSKRYFSRSGNLLDWNAVKDPDTGASIGPDFSSVEVIEMTIHFHKKAIIKGSGDSITNTVIRVAFRNG